MNADLEKLIGLQHLDTAAAEAQKKLAEEPERTKAFDARIEAAKQNVAAAKERLAANQAQRREIEKDVAVHQGRLSKFREQAMAVKTNQEYHAIQHEIAFAQTEIKKREDQILELMLAADELTAAVKKADAAMAAEQKSVDADRQALAKELADRRGDLQRIAAERAQVVSGLTPQVLSTFELIAKRRGGIAIAEARDGMCTVCHVRLRPQVFNTVRRNEAIIQCDSCQRILHYVPVTVPS
jgi:predicted  nucleic acid-binding Zn-ribbon protein